MKKESFEFLKTLANLENCIECVQDDVQKLLMYVPEDSVLDRKGISKKADQLKYWLNKAIRDYNE